MKLYARIVFVVLVFTAGNFSASAQRQNLAEEFKCGGLKSFSMSGGEEKTFVVNLKKDGFIEFNWLANDDLDLRFEFLDSAGSDLLKEIYVIDSIMAVAPADGVYRLVLHLGENDSAQEKKIVSEQKISLQCSEVFKLPPRSILNSFRKINGYDVKIWDTQKDDGYSYLLIEKLGRLKAILKGENFGAAGFYFADDIARTYTPAEKRSANLMKTTVDKTGDGTPDVAVGYFSGGAHCCFDLHFYEFGDTVRHVPYLATGDAGVVATGKSGTGGLRLETSDGVFRYWNVAFAYSPFPSVILKFQDGEFRPNFAAMTKPAPSLAVLQKKAREARAKLTAAPYTGADFGPNDFEEAFWGEMLDLIYTGHEDLAWQYLDLVWRTDKPGKEIFIKDFTEQLNKSVYWQMIKKEAVKKN